MPKSTTRSLEAVVAALNVIPPNKHRDEETEPDDNNAFTENDLLPRIAVLLQNAVQLPDEQNSEQDSPIAVIVDTEKVTIHYVTQSSDEGAKCEYLRDLWSAMQAIVKKASVHLPDEDPVYVGLFLALCKYHFPRWMLDHLRSGWEDFQAMANALMGDPLFSGEIKDKLATLLSSMRGPFQKPSPSLDAMSGIITSMATFYVSKGLKLPSTSVLDHEFDMAHYLQTATKPLNPVFHLIEVARNAASQKIFDLPLSVMPVNLPAAENSVYIPTSLTAWEETLTKLVANNNNKKRTIKLKQDFSELVGMKYSAPDGKVRCRVYSEVALLEWMRKTQRMSGGECCVALSTQPSVPSMIYHSSLNFELDDEEGEYPPRLAWNPSAMVKGHPFLWSLPANSEDDFKDTMLRRLLDYLMEALENAELLVPVADD
ncbi:hypothetical protein NLJ89_g4154 [Agrocybe chaxingu]|uniref:Uncharacterized protein n=1 Tax=Agrocybe chaxingu TaxID=84603 RepID=A0A9W8K3E4_9AGAR|nr:hypothetical protein NLJ89_g4154 [Agrocybe chaxingu]